MIGARRLFSSLEHVFRTKKGEQKQYESNTQKKWMIKQWNFGYFFSTRYVWGLISSTHRWVYTTS